MIAALRDLCWALWVRGRAQGESQVRNFLRAELCSLDTRGTTSRCSEQQNEERPTPQHILGQTRSQKRLSSLPACLFFAVGGAGCLTRGWERGQPRCQGARARIPRSHPEPGRGAGPGSRAVNDLPATEGLDQCLQLLPARARWAGSAVPSSPQHPPLQKPSSAALPTSRTLQPCARTPFSPQLLPQSPPSCFLLQRKRNKLPKLRPRAEPCWKCWQEGQQQEGGSEGKVFPTCSQPALETQPLLPGEAEPCPGAGEAPGWAQLGLSRRINCGIGL